MQPWCLVGGGGGSESLPGAKRISYRASSVTLGLSLSSRERGWPIPPAAPRTVTLDSCSNHKKRAHRTLALNREQEARYGVARKTRGGNRSFHVSTKAKGSFLVFFQASKQARCGVLCWAYLTSRSREGTALDSCGSEHFGWMWKRTRRRRRRRQRQRQEKKT